MIVLAAFALAAAGWESALDPVLAHDALQGASVGVCVMRMDGTVVYQRNADVPLVPASCAKVPTIAFAYERLGADARPTTRFWRTEAGAYVDAPGDPGLTSAQLREAAKALALPKGAVVEVRQAYDPGHGPGWQYDDLPYDYAAPAAAFAVDRSAFVLRASKGKPVPPDPALGLRFRAVAAKGGPQVRYDPARAALTVTGTARGEAAIEELAQPSPAKFAAALLGGTFAAAVGPPPDRPADYEIVGRPWLDHAQECGERSVNVLAEHLFLLAFGAADYRLASEGAASLYRETGVAPGAAQQVDGSGLSRRNRSSARALCQVLAWSRGRPWWPELDRCLAAPGEGTLEKRLAGSTFRGKTGTMRGIVALCGVFTAPDGTEFALAILVNGSTRPASNVRAVQDRFVRAAESLGSPPQRLG
jgi:D-alanyl-D-alanine carboxypeptidase/D-alanyl-D-alanine-endopeptidase (penicillin-binding protein 4)